MVIKKIEALLKEHAFFQDMQPQFIDSLAGCGGALVRSRGEDNASRREDRSKLFRENSQP